MCLFRFLPHVQWAMGSDCLSHPTHGAASKCLSFHVFLQLLSFTCAGGVSVCEPYVLNQQFSWAHLFWPSEWICCLSYYFYSILLRCTFLIVSDSWLQIFLGKIKEAAQDRPQYKVELIKGGMAFPNFKLHYVAGPLKSLGRLIWSA